MSNAFKTSMLLVMLAVGDVGDGDVGVCAVGDVGVGVGDDTKLTIIK